MKEILYGAAYYYEYMPYDRLDKDIELMKAAGINVVRIAESTWSTYEIQDGIFNFSSIDKVLDAMYEAGIKVIIGTPTYAVPSWLVKKYPEVLAITKNGPAKYGARQLMDIINPTYLRYAERIIRKMLEHVCNHPAIIGYQVDNETKHYGTVGENVQNEFVKYIKKKFDNNLELLNKKYGLDYWSNRINSWEDFPSVVGTINGSLGAEFSKFQRNLVTNFLSWQVKLVKEYSKKDQFVTHNFDFEWRGYSFGFQPDVDNYEASKAVDVTGIDVYHPSQEELTGIEISFAGDIARSTKFKNYFVLETQAQGFKQWVPFPNQLRLQAFSHIASGANMIEYWHWHSIHNSFETYWKGLLSHDFKPNPVYNEAKTIGRDLKRISSSVVDLTRTNKVAFLLSNECLTALEWFPFSSEKNYNDLFRRLYDVLYKMNVSVDIISTNDIDIISNYELLIVPALYCASDNILLKLNSFVNKGGNIIYTFKSGFADENLKVRTTEQPGIIGEACGINYSLFVDPKNIGLNSEYVKLVQDENTVTDWAELVNVKGAEVLATYDHRHWGKYAAITRNKYGKGTAVYIACFPSESIIHDLFEKLLTDMNLYSKDQELCFPIITKHSINKNKNKVHFYFNYSDDKHKFKYVYHNGVELLKDNEVSSDFDLDIEPWGALIIEESVSK